MNSFQIIQTLAIHARFTVFEARGERFQFPVVLKRCEYREVLEAEFFIRSALMKTKAKVYTQPLLSIFADVDGGKSLIMFVWKKGEARDIEVERDEESQFPPGKAGYAKSKVLCKNPQPKEAIRQALSLTLGKKVVLKISKNEHIWNMNSVFSEALVQAKCAHPNVCDFLDFRLFQGKKSKYYAYIVMESLEQDLDMELQERKLRAQPYDEVELMVILKQMVTALLNAKSQDLAHQDIKPHNILKGPQGLKLAGFGSNWLKELYSRTSSAIDTEMYIAPEVREAMGNPRMQQRPFESDVFSLGMTVLHLAAMELPERISAMSRGELQALLQQKVQTLIYSEEFKRLLMAMLNIAPSDRPPLETVQVDAERIYRQAAQRLTQEALRLRLQTRSNIREGKNAEAIELAAAAHAIYSRLPEDKHTAINLNNWGYALNNMGRSTEAVEKYSAAHAIYSRLPEDKSTANNLNNWGYALNNMERSAEAVEKFATAHTIYSRLPEDNYITKNLSSWGYMKIIFARMSLFCMIVWVLMNWESTVDNMGRIEEAEQYGETYAICSQLLDDKNTAYNLHSWELTLNNIGKCAETEKCAATHTTQSRLSEDNSTANNLGNWEWALDKIERSVKEVKKNTTVHAIYFRILEEFGIIKNLYNRGYMKIIFVRMALFCMIVWVLMKWGSAVDNMRRFTEAVGKDATAHIIYLRHFENKSTANNFANWGLALRNVGRNTEAVEKFAAAHAIYSQFPEDKDTADNLKYWEHVLHYMGWNAEAVEKCVAAHTVYSRFPEDKSAASNLSSWGWTLINIGKSAEAMEKYAAAHTIYSRFLEGRDTADNLGRWGLALSARERREEAVEKFAAAHAIYSRLPEDKHTADNLHNWGWTLNNMGRSAEAVEKYEAAHTIYSRLLEGRGTADNLGKWGLALSAMGRSAEAVEKYAAAHVLYSRFSKDKSAAGNLRKWGLALYYMGKSAEAVEKYEAADTIYSRFSEDKDAAKNLENWGLALYYMRKSAEAMEKYEAARAIFVLCPFSIEVENIDAVLLQLSKSDSILGH